MARQPSLFGTTAPANGPVYQGVAAQVRALFPKTDDAAQAKRAELAGWIRLALSHARAIDATPSASVGRAQTSAELREALGYIADAMAGGDVFDAFLEELSGGRRAETPHPQE